MNVTKHKVVKVKGMTTKWARKNAVKSGVTTLFASNSVIDDSTDELIIPTGETIKLGRRNKDKRGSTTTRGSGSLDPTDMIWNRNLASVVVRKDLVIQIKAADAATTASESQLADDVFGAAGDALNLKSQFNQCSYGQPHFEPTTSNALVGTDGVYTVSLPSTTVTGAADNPIAWAAVDKATAELGDLTSIADHVMRCMPPGTSGGWLAYAYINHWLSVFNDSWCGYPSATMHELGHNFGLAHSSEGSSEYDDKIWVDGTSILFRRRRRSVMCFNGPKHGNSVGSVTIMLTFRLPPGSAGLAIWLASCKRPTQR
ncbi:Gametolysin peptidase M11 [Fragilaria crotonensis]|nr:Gametolysin peptidase M11 [Fragilaria crotonensis]